MKQFLIITVLSLITATQAFSGPRNGGWSNGHGGGGFGYPNESPHNGHHRAGVQKVPLVLNEHMRGQSIIKLKRELSNQRPGMNLRDFDLVSVKLVAKSKRGRGEATLVVGQAQTYPETIGGNQYDFHTPAPYTFDRMRFQNPAYDSQGKWQVHLRGNIKVKKVVLFVKNKGFSRGVRNFTIPMYGQHLRGQNTLKLKRLIKQNNPGFNFHNAKIVSVNMMAKSKHGGGQASLVVGHDVSYPATIPGNPRGFHSMAPRSFSSVYLSNHSGYSDGKWQIQLRGNIKVQHITITVRNEWNDGHRSGGARSRRGQRGGGRFDIY